MTTYWKQLGAWVTGSGFNKPILIARLTVTGVFFVLAIVASMVCRYAFDVVSKAIIIEHTRTAVAGTARAHEIIADLRTTENWVQAVSIFIMPLVAWVASGYTLRPLRRIMEAQKRFMANAAHELRTPLAVIKTETETTLLEKSVSHDKAVALMNSTLQEVDRMAYRIKNLLMLSNFDSDMAPLPFSRVDLGHIVARSIKGISGQIKDKKLHFSSDNNSAYIYGNEGALDEMTSNIIRNAVQFTPAAGSVSISLQVHGQRAVLKVSDSGPGIKNSEKTSVFEPFYRSDEARKFHPLGSGLGLALVRSIAERHSGRVALADSPDAGTTVTVSLPIK